MSDAASQILATFETLPVAEQHEIVTQLLRRSSVLSDYSLSDESLVAVADDLFQLLDAEEKYGDDAGTR